MTNGAVFGWAFHRRGVGRMWGALGLVLLLAASGALGQEAGKPADAAAPEQGAAEKKPAAKPEAKKEQNIDETVKGFQKLSGLFTFYRQKKGTTDTLMLELPEDRLGQLLMLQVTASTGAEDTPAGIFHGEPLRDLLFRMEKVDDSRVVFLQPSIQFRAPHDAPTRRTLERTYPDTVLQSFEIKARQPDRHSILIDVSDLFKADVADLGRRFDRAGYTLDHASSYVDSLKVLPANVVVRSVYQLDRKGPGGPAAGAAPRRGGGGEGPRSFPFAVDYDLYPLPSTSYRPRLGDTRVGYFTTSYEDDSDAGARDKTVNYLLRWNLEKADPAAPLSPPKQPIVFWIDNAVPEKYRSAIREGLLMWNPAFERIGIKDAIVVNLGLRHNFIASTESTFDQLKNAGWVKRHGVTASVMDYTPPNLAAIKQKGDDYFSSVVGSYDTWATEYGYRPIDAGSPEEERPALARIAGQCNVLGHAYQSDQMGDQYDPLIARFDLGKDPLDWTSRTFELSRYLLLTLDQREPKPGQSFYLFTRDFNALVSRYFSAASYTARFIGGLSVSSNFHGDPGERPPLLPVAGAQQQRALRLLNRYIFSENAFQFPRRYLSMLAANPNVPGNQPDAAAREFPIFDTFASFQRGLLQELFTPDRLDRLANSEFRAANPQATLTMVTLFRSIGDQVWSELRDGHEISALRRSLQVDHLNLLLGLAMNRSANLPADATTLAREELRTLQSRLTAALPTARGEYGPSHLREALLRIQHAEEARPVAQP